MLRPQLQPFLQLALGLSQLALLQADEAKLVGDLRIVRVELARAQQGHLRLRRPARLTLGQPLLIEGLGRRTQSASVLELLRGVRGPAHPTVGAAEQY